MIIEKRGSLSSRGAIRAATGGRLLDKFKEIFANPYDPETNPDGFVNIGVAENVCSESTETSIISNGLWTKYTNLSSSI